MILIDWITSASCKIKVVVGLAKLGWGAGEAATICGTVNISNDSNTNFRSATFQHSHGNLWMPCLGSRLRLRLRSRHLAKKRVEPKRATPKNRHGSSRRNGGALENLATVWRLLNGAGRSYNSLDATPAPAAPPPPAARRIHVSSVS